MKKKYQSKILEAIHEEAQALYKVGAINDKEMQEFDASCLVPKKAKKAVAKSVFSSHIDAPPTTVYASPK
jgi:DNA-binding transcriptional regulator YiaG